jgi:excisionase family DNA binding protein
MNTTSESQLELRGVGAGSGECAENPPPSILVGAASEDAGCPRATRRDEIGSRPNMAAKLKGPRHGGEAGAVEPLLNFAEVAGVLGISLRQFRRLVDGGRIAFVRVSEPTPRVRPSELQRFLDASAVKYSEVQS